jgi:hypothetical protein
VVNGLRFSPRLRVSAVKSEAGYENTQKEAPVLSKRPTAHKPGRRHHLRFEQVKGKTIEFIEMGADADYPSVEIGFEDKTALHFLVDTRITIEPRYSEWKTGNQRVLRQWPVVECK